MCLIVDDTIKIDFDDNGEFIAYKCLMTLPNDDVLRTPIALHVVGGPTLEVKQEDEHVYGPNFLFVKNGDEIDVGAIHVFLDKDSCEKYALHLDRIRFTQGLGDYDYHVLPCLVKKQDFIACGHTSLAAIDSYTFKRTIKPGPTFKSAVFTKIEFLVPVRKCYLNNSKT